MSTVNAKIKVGCKGSGPMNCSEIKLVLELHQDKIQQHIEEYGQKINKYKMPMAVFEIPKNIKGIQIPIFTKKSQDFIRQTLEKEDVVFEIFDHKQTEIMMALKKFEKLFGKLTSLDNKAQLAIKLFNVDGFLERLKQRKENPLLIYLENIQINAQINLEAKFCEVLGESFNNLSPTFSKSPLFALIELFEGLQFEFQCESPSELMQKIRQNSIPEIIGFEEPDNDEKGKIIEQALKSEEKIRAYFHFGKLGYMSLEVDAKVWAHFLCAQLH